MSLRSWRGPEVQKKILKASMLGINVTMFTAVTFAKSNHEFRNRTSSLEGSVRVVELARRVSKNKIAGLWGSTDAPHVLSIELGAKPHTIVPRKRRILSFVINGVRIFTHRVKHPGNKPMPFLRPSADLNYTKLARNIRKALKSG